MNFQKLLLHGALSVEVKIAVVRQVQNRILIAPRRIVEHQPVSLPAELHRYRQRAGIPLLAVRRDAREPDTVRLLRSLPDVFVKAAQTAVQMVLTVVFRQPVRLSVQRKFRAADAVAEAADCRAIETGVAGIAGQIVIAEHNVDKTSYPIGNLNAADRRTIVQKLRAQAMRIFHRPAGYGSTVCKCAERTLCNLHMVSPFHTALRLPVSRQALNGYRILSAPSSLILPMQ